VTIRDDHAFCDGAHRADPAVTPITSDWFEEWERIPMDSGSEAHLCPACIEHRDRGWLAEPFVLVCVRCGANSIDEPKRHQWRAIPDLSGERQSVTVCGDCFEPGMDSFKSAD
jgi:hypothetical protein